MKKKLFLIILFLISISLAYAHQPRIAKDNSLEDAIIVKDPEISKAYYGELDGEPHYYKINSESEFNIYLNVLIPGKELTHTVSAELSKDGKIISSLDGEDFEWSVFYEEFGKDYYMKGPELGEDFKSTSSLTSGEYLIKVFNDGNKGKYVLAVGDIESFPIGEILRAGVTLPYLKVSFFGKYYILLGLIIVILIVYWFIIRRKWKRKSGN